MLDALGQPIEAILDPPGRLLGPYWRISVKKGGGVHMHCPSKVQKLPCGCARGVVLERSWALLGPSWKPLVRPLEA
eukprot:5674827-Pyramimonas_sp.AAC.2